MNSTHAQHGMTSDGRYIYVCGGITLFFSADLNRTTTTWTQLCERYDTVTDVWTPIADLTSPARAGFQLLHVAGRLYAVGGTTIGYVGVSNIDVYDTNMNKTTGGVWRASGATLRSDQSNQYLSSVALPLFNGTLTPTITATAKPNGAHAFAPISHGAAAACLMIFVIVQQFVHI